MRRDLEVGCDAASAAVLTLAEDGSVAAHLRSHIETCLRCQADLARYRSLRRNLAAMRLETMMPPVGALSSTLTALRAQPDPRRSIPVGGVVATAAGAVAGVAGMLVWRSRRSVA